VIGEALFGYALLHAATGFRLLPWLWRQPFGTAYWAYTFGLSALPLAALRLVERGESGPIAAMALPLLALSTTLIGAIALGTMRLLVEGRLITPPAPATSVRRDAAA
jgi:tellurite resistance protein